MNLCPVGALALDGHEQVARFERAAIDGNAAARPSALSGAAIAAEISSKVQSGSCIGCAPYRCERCGYGLMIGKRYHLFADNLSRFMAFSGHEQNIPLL